MKLLYLSCHSILEHDEVKLFAEMGIDVFSWGTYKTPQKVDDPKRPGLDILCHPEFLDLIKDDDKSKMPQELIDWADVIMVMHRDDWLHDNWERIKHKKVIWRSIGQSSLEVEGALKTMRQEGLTVVRYSPREQTIPGYVGSDALIRFYKDSEEFNNWNGAGKFVLNISQDMIAREKFCNYSFFERATLDFPRMLIGKGSEGLIGWGKGITSYDYMKEQLRNCGCYFYTGTYPASYTLNFMEALMTGCPMVALGPITGTSPDHPGQQTYEVPDWSENGKNILLADTIEIAKQHVGKLLSDGAYASEMSARSRALALKLFNKEDIKAQWKAFLGV